MKLQITIDGKTYEVEVEVLEDDESARHSSYGPYQPTPAVVQSVAYPATPAQAPPPERIGGDDRVCLSPVTGLVITVYVEPGQLVQPNDLIMVLEAMKMETNITAPRAGAVKSVHVAAGDSVKENQVLVEFE